MNLDAHDKLGSNSVKEEQKKLIENDLIKYFRPEFLNRIDDIVFFHPLVKDHINRIIKIQLARLKKRLEDRNIFLKINDNTVNHLAEIGFESRYGARPLKRAIRKELETALAKSILSGGVKEVQKITANYTSGKISFEKN